jgi:peptide/nickel transport system substrate-binding protein
MALKRKLAYLFILGGVFLYSFFSIQVVMAEDIPAPKPGWMEWGEAFWPTKPVRGGLYRAASPFYIGVMNPNHFPVMDWITMGYIYEKLINHDGAYRPTAPWLAESWEFLDDVTVLMKLRKGVQFHDGSPFNAESVKYQIEWILDKKNGAWSRSWLDPLKSVEVVDAHTIKWHFHHPWGAFLGTMASVPGYQISMKALKTESALSELKLLNRRLQSTKRKVEKTEKKAEEEKDKGGNSAEKLEAEAEAARKELADMEEKIRELKELSKNARPLDAYPVGSGQYMIEKNSPGNYVQLKRNPDWWFGKSVGFPDMPYFDGYKVSVIPDSSVRLASLKAGTLDAITINPFQYKIVEKDKKLELRTIPLNWLVWLMLNQAEGPCKDIRVRKAISHAIDRKALIMGVQFGMGREASCIFPDTHWTHNPDLKPVSYDPELSKKLLAEAGYADGLTLRGVTANTPEAQAFAEATTGMLEKVGIKWDVKFLSIAGMGKPFMNLEYDMAGGLFQWIFEPDLISTALYTRGGVLNYGRNNNEEVIALIKAGRQETEESKRIKIYHQLEKALYDNYMDIYLFYPMMVVASSKNLQGFNIDMYREYGEVFVRSHPYWFKDGRP